MKLRLSSYILSVIILFSLVSVAWAQDSKISSENLTREISRLKEIIHSKPSDIDVYVALGKLLLSNGDSDAAESIFKDGITATTANNISLYFNLARLYQERGEDARAVELLEQYLRTDPNQPDVLHHLASIYCFSLKEYKSALIYALRFNDRDTTNSDINFIIGSCYCELGKFEKAITFLKRSAEQNPENQYVYTAIGDCYKQKGDLEQAILQWKKYLSYDPENVGVLQCIGHAYDTLGSIEEARLFFYKAFLKDPTVVNSIAESEHILRALCAEYPSVSAYINQLEAPLVAAQHDEQFHDVWSVNVKHSHGDSLGQTLETLKDVNAVYSREHKTETAWFYWLFAGICIVGIVVDSLIARIGRLNKQNNERDVLSIKRTVILIGLFSALFVCYRLLYWRAAANNPEFLFRGGLLAKDMLGTLKCSILEYNFTPWEGAGTFIGIVTTPFFLLFGDSFFSLYLVALLLPLLQGVLLFLFSRRHFGAITAIIATYIYVLAPFRFVYDYTAVLGYHNESVLFTLILFACFYEVFFNPLVRQTYFNISTTGVKKGWILLLMVIVGGLSGFATYVCYTFLASLFVIGIAWIIYDRRLFLRPYIYMFIFAFLCGFSPWIYFNVTHHFLGLRLPVHGSAEELSLFQTFLTKGIKFRTTFSFLQWNIIDTFSLEPVKTYLSIFMPRQLFYFIMAGAGLSGVYSFCTLIRFNKMAPSVAVCTYKKSLIVCYCLVMTIFYALHPMIWPSPIYYHPVYPFLFILVGLLVQSLWKLRIHGVYFRTLSILLTVVIVVSGYGYYRDASVVLPAEDFRNAKKLKGYSLFYHYSLPLDEWNDIYLQDLFCVSLFLQPQHLSGASDIVNPFSIFSKLLGRNAELVYDKPWESLDKEYLYLDTIPPNYRPALCVALGVTIGDGLTETSLKTIPSDLSNRVDVKYHPYLYEGIAISYCDRLYDEVERITGEHYLENYIPPQYRHFFYYEIGRSICQKYKNTITSALAYINAMPQEFRPVVFQGFSTTLTREQIKILDNEAPPDLKNCLARRRGEFVGRGIFFGYGDETMITHHASEIEAPYIDDYYKGVLSGLCKITIRKQAYKVMYSPKQVYTDVLDKLARFIVPEDKQGLIYESLGIEMSIWSYGIMSDEMNAAIEEYVPDAYRKQFASGYEKGIQLRYGDAENILAIATEQT